MKKSSRSLALQRTTLRSLSASVLSSVDGGTVFTGGNAPVAYVSQDCPGPITLPTVTRASAVDACPTRIMCTGGGTGGTIGNPPPGGF